MTIAGMTYGSGTSLQARFDAMLDTTNTLLEQACIRVVAAGPVHTMAVPALTIPCGAGCTTVPTPLSIDLAADALLAIAGGDSTVAYVWLVPELAQPGTDSLGQPTLAPTVDAYGVSFAPFHTGDPKSRHILVQFDAPESMPILAHEILHLIANSEHLDGGEAGSPWPTLGLQYFFRFDVSHFPYNSFSYANQNRRMTANTRHTARLGWPAGNAQPNVAGNRLLAPWVTP